MGDFFRLDSMIALGNLRGADSICKLIAPIDSMEINEHTVDSIYIHALQVDSFTSIDSTILLSIADEDILRGGPGVILARILLEYEPCSDTTSPRFVQSESVFEDFKKLLVYPNPTEGSFTVSYPLEEGQSARIEIRDIAGRLLCEQRMISSNEMMNCENLTQGVYVGRLLLENGEVFNFKIVRIK